MTRLRKVACLPCSAQAGQIAGAVAGADGGEVFAEGDIAHVREAGFDAPVAATGGLELGAVAGGIGAAGEGDLQFFGHREGFEMMGGAKDEGGLGGVRKPGLLRGDGEGIGLAGFMPAVALAQGEVRREKRRPYGRGARAG